MTSIFLLAKTSLRLVVIVGLANEVFPIEPVSCIPLVLICSAALSFTRNVISSPAAESRTPTNLPIAPDPRIRYENARSLSSLGFVF